MKTRYSIFDIRNALDREIAGAINESSMLLNVQISETSINEAYSVKGSFKVTPLFGTEPRRQGKFEAKLDESLRIISLKITEETK